MLPSLHASGQHSDTRGFSLQNFLSCPNRHQIYDTNVHMKYSVPQILILAKVTGLHDRSSPSMENLQLLKLAVQLFTVAYERHWSLRLHHKYAYLLILLNKGNWWWFDTTIFQYSYSFGRLDFLKVHCEIFVDFLMWNFKIIISFSSLRYHHIFSFNGTFLAN